jgi:ribulose-phosphate 3-epimerase
MEKFILSTSILSADFGHLEDQIHQVETAGADWIHVDVMDGHFVPNISMGPVLVETCKRITRLPIDVHLMISNPEHHIDAFVKAGANHLTIHIENNPNVHRTLQAIRALGCSPGIALNPGTAVNNITSVINAVDMVLVMTVNPGYSGQSYIPESLEKISEVNHLLRSRHSSVLIEVDGGLTAQNLPQAFANGARVVVAATAVFKHPRGIAAGINDLRGSIP